MTCVRFSSKCSLGWSRSPTGHVAAVLHSGCPAHAGLEIPACFTAAASASFPYLRPHGADDVALPALSGNFESQRHPCLSQPVHCGTPFQPLGRFSFLQRACATFEARHLHRSVRGSVGGGTLQRVETCRSKQARPWRYESKCLLQGAVDPTCVVRGKVGRFELGGAAVRGFIMLSILSCLNNCCYRHAYNRQYQMMPMPR